jgi:transcriptional regulator with XRE-family HTH domain
VVLSIVLRSAGGLLRAWRRQQGLTQGEVAALLYVSTASVSSWETGTRGIPREALELLDEEYEADGCLVDLVRAIGTPQGYRTMEDGRLVPRPHQYWPHVFTHETGPIWIWIRSAAPGRIAGGLYVGPNRLLFDASAPDPDEHAGVGGVFVTFPAWNRMWPIHVVLDAPGWVDFGRGTLPACVASQAQLVGGPDDLEFRGRDPRETIFLGDQVRELDRGDPDTFVDRMRTLIGEGMWDRFAAPADARSDPAPVQPDDRTGVRSQAERSEQRDLHRRLREARGLSRTDAAEIASELLRSASGPVRGRVTEDQVYNYETGRRSRVPYLGALLDLVYGAGGWTCFEPVPVRRQGPGEFVADFPRWWTGPVTVRVGQARTGRADPVGRPVDRPADSVRLATSRWVNEQRLDRDRRSFTYCRVAREDELAVSVPPGRSVRAFIGHDPDAVPLGRGWVPTPSYAADAFAAFLQMLLVAIGRTPDDFDRALARSVT